MPSQQQLMVFMFMYFLCVRVGARLYVGLFGCMHSWGLPTFPELLSRSAAKTNKGQKAEGPLSAVSAAAAAAVVAVKETAAGAAAAARGVPGASHSPDSSQVGYTACIGPLTS